MRITIDKHKATHMEATKALVWNVNVDSGSLPTVTEGTEPNLKHSQTCACLICDRRRDECISMQETYLMDIGQGPNSQQADEHMKHLLGLGIEIHTFKLQWQTETMFDCTPLSMHARTQMDDINIRNTAFFVPETPATGATEKVCTTSPAQASEIETI